MSNLIAALVLAWLVWHALKHSLQYTELAAVDERHRRSTNWLFILALAYILYFLRTRSR